MHTQKIRCITNSAYNEHTDPLFKNLNILKLKQLYHLNIARFMYKAFNKELPSQVANLYKPNMNVHNHNTKQNRNAHIRYRRTQLASKQVNHKGPEIWQNLLNDIKISKKLKTLTKSNNKYLLNARS